MPTATPVTAMTSGRSQRASVCRKLMIELPSLAPPVAAFMNSPRSLPAENAPGTPQMTRQRIGEDPPALVIASDIASYIAKVSAFFFSARFIRIVRIGPSSVTMTCSVMRPSSRAAQRRVGYRLRAFSDRGLKSAGLHRDVLGEEARERDTATAIEPTSAVRKRVLGEHAATGGRREQPQVWRRTRKRRVGRFVELATQPRRRVVKALDRFAKARARRAETGIVRCLHGRHRAAQLVEIAAHHRAAHHWNLARDQINRLNTVGALVDLRDSRIAVMLRDAGLLDEAHASVHLHAERSDFGADVGRESLGNRRQQ